MSSHAKRADVMDDAPTYEERVHATAIAWRDAAYRELKAGRLTALELGKRTCPGKRADRVFAGLAVRRAARWPAYFVVLTLADGTYIDLVPWDYNRRKTV